MRVSTPVQRIVLYRGQASGVVTAGGEVEAAAGLLQPVDGTSGQSLNLPMQSICTVKYRTGIKERLESWLPLRAST